MQRTVEAMGEEGCPYRGVLYGQFMLTREGPKVIEFNARFGDPEAMNVLSMLQLDLVHICRASATGSYPRAWSPSCPKATVCKYVVPEGYGTEPKAGLPVHVDEKAIARLGAACYYAMVDEEDGRILTTTSRAVGVVGVADTIEEAEATCEAALTHVKGDAIFVRHDIGKRELVQRRVEHMRQVRERTAQCMRTWSRSPRHTGQPGREGHRPGDRHQVLPGHHPCRAAFVHGMHKREDVSGSIAEAMDEAHRLRSLLEEHLEIWNSGIVQDALQELAEAAILTVHGEGRGPAGPGGPGHARYRLPDGHGRRHRRAATLRPGGLAPGRTGGGGDPTWT